MKNPGKIYKLKDVLWRGPVEEISRQITYHSGKWRLGYIQAVPRLLEMAIEQDFCCALCGYEWPNVIVGLTPAEHVRFIFVNAEWENPATIDHMDPLSTGGKDTKQNRALACTKCNSTKGNFPHSIAQSVLAINQGPVRWAT